MNILSKLIYKQNNFFEFINSYLNFLDVLNYHI
jgi:hypothetical protein